MIIHAAGPIDYVLTGVEQAIFLSAMTTYIRDERLITVAEVEEALGGLYILFFPMISPLLTLSTQFRSL